MSFIENLRDALANKLESGQNNIVHLSERQPLTGSYSGIGLPENGFRSPKGQYKRPDESKTAYDSLRRGEDVSQDGVTYKGGIYGTRFLGNTPNDFLNASYFSDEDVSDSYSPVNFTIEDRSSGKAEKVTISYDKNGAIAEISTGKGDITGASNISDFFKQFSWNDGRYSVNGYVLGEGNVSTPTYVFGSRGRSSYKHNDGASKRWTFDNSANKKAFYDYYRQLFK